MTPKIPARSEMPASDTWDLTPLFLTEEDYRDAFARLKEIYSKIAQYKTRLGESANTLFECLEFEKSRHAVAGANRKSNESVSQTDRPIA